MRLQLAAPDDWAAGIQDVVAGPGLDSYCVVAGGRVVPVSEKIGIGVYLEALAAFGVQHDSLQPRGLEVL